MKVSKQELRSIILEAVKELKDKLEKERDPSPEPKEVGDKLLLLDDEEDLDATLDDGCPCCSACLMEYMAEQKAAEVLEEAKYQGRDVPLGKPMKGDVKKFKVYVRDPKTGNIKKVNFGDPNMRIKKSDPARRKSFRARHKCKTAKDRTTARYWSCRKW